MNTYYYDGISFSSIDNMIDAVRHDVDFSFGDADLDRILRDNGSAEIDGLGLSTSSALKRHSYSEYRKRRNDIIDQIVSEVREGVELELFPIRVPYTYNVIECSE